MMKSYLRHKIGYYETSNKLFIVIFSKTRKYYKIEFEIEIEIDLCQQINLLERLI